MILTLKQYSRIFKINGQWVSYKTIERLYDSNLLPSGHIRKQLPGSKGAKLIDVSEVPGVDSLQMNEVHKKLIPV